MSIGQNNLLQVLHKRVETLRSEGKIEDAIRVAQTAIDAAKRNVAADKAAYPALLDTLLMFADLKRMSGRFDEAESVYLEALDICADPELSFELDELVLAGLQSGLASLYDFTSREDSAIPLYEEAIQRFESLDPPQFVDAAYLYNNLGMIHKQKGEFEQAEQAYLRALEAFSSAEGESAPSVGTVLNNLGGLYSSMGQVDRAREMHIRAMDIRESVHPSNHPELGQSLCNLATVYHELDDFNNARKHYEAALRLFEKNLDSSSDDYEILTSNYSQLLREHGQEKKAGQLEKRAAERLQSIEVGQLI